VVRGAVVTFADVTERQKLEQRLQQINRVSSLGRMAATIAHEFNNVLMGIQPFAESIRRRTTDPKLQQAASQILNSVNRGKGVTQDILRTTRTQEPALESVDMTIWLGQVADEIRPQMNGRITVDIQAPPPATLFARCDPSQMQQVLTNLALNARDAMPGDGKLTLSLHAGETVHVVLADTGCGIPAETLPFIFEPLFTTKRSGTGLGLAVVQQLVLSNGGTIHVESVVGEGTQFDIELPRAAPVAPRAPDAQPVSPRHFGVRRVLVVEDDPEVAAGLTAILEAEGVETSIVTNGSEAMGRAADFQPDAILIDIGLPDMSGIEVYEQIAARWPRLPVIFSTGHAEESRMPKPQQHIGFLRKPYGTEMLLAKLREVVR
jgi:CheY-like chemotaxis protein